MSAMFRFTEQQVSDHIARIGSATGRTVKKLSSEDDKPARVASSSKYRNKKVQTEEASFASEREHRRYLELKLLEKAGKICGLELQKRFILAEGYEYNGKKIPPLRYFADFVYEQDNKTVVEDSKGFLTRVYLIKRHLMFSLLGIKIFET